MIKLNNLNCDETQNSNGEETQEFKLWWNSKTLGMFSRVGGGRDIHFISASLVFSMIQNWDLLFCDDYDDTTDGDVGNDNNDHNDKENHNKDNHNNNNHNIENYNKDPMKGPWQRGPHQRQSLRR